MKFKFYLFLATLWILNTYAECHKVGECVPNPVDVHPGINDLVGEWVLCSQEPGNVKYPNYHILDLQNDNPQKNLNKKMEIKNNTINNSNGIGTWSLSNLPPNKDKLSINLNSIINIDNYSYVLSNSNQNLEIKKGEIIYIYKRKPLFLSDWKLNSLTRDGFTIDNCIIRNTSTDFSVFYKIAKNEGKNKCPNGDIFKQSYKSFERKDIKTYILDTNIGDPITIENIDIIPPVNFNTPWNKIQIKEKIGRSIEVETYTKI